MAKDHLQRLEFTAPEGAQGIRLRTIVVRELDTETVDAAIALMCGKYKDSGAARLRLLYELMALAVEEIDGCPVTSDDILAMPIRSLALVGAAFEETNSVVLRGVA